MERRPTIKSERSVAFHWQMLVVTLLWGLNIPIVKVALSEFSPLVFDSLRQLPTAMLMVGLAWAIEGSPHLEWRDWKWLLVLGVLGHFFRNLGFILGIACTTASNSSLILNPGYCADLGCFARHTIGHRTAFEVAMGWYSVFLYRHRLDTEGGQHSGVSPCRDLARRPDLAGRSDLLVAVQRVV